MKMIIHKFEMPLKHVFAISRRSFNSQDNIVVELQHNGKSGFGEATSNPYYPNTEIPTLEKALEQVRSIIENHDLNSPTAFWEQMQSHLSDYPFALCALDEAANDLFGKLQGKSLIELWNINNSILPQSSYTLGMEAPEILIKRMEETPWPVYKIKLGGPKDLETLKILRNETQAKFRVDINCAWTASETIDNSFILKDLGVEFIEQPLPAEAWEEMEEVFEKSALPLIADESCKSFEDIKKCVKRFHGINIKLMKCGGLTPAINMIEEARALNLKVMMGCMTESTVGLSAIGQLLPLLDYVDMDGALFLKQDIATGVKVNKAGITLPEGAGTGAALIPESEQYKK